LITVPDEDAWLRMERIAADLHALPADEAAAQLAVLQQDGESPSILSLVAGWLALPSPPSPLGQGDTIGGRYMLTRKLGHGGMGTVWQATQEMIGRPVAVKLIHPSLVTPSHRVRFMHEMQILGRLEHPGIVKVFDAGLHEHGEESIPFFVMECVEGIPLAQWANEHRADRGRLLRLVSEMCAAVQHAHDRKVVHRDLKPSNILVRRDGQPVILDFGISRLAGGPNEPFGGFSGTPHYAAPEQHLGQDRDFRSGESVDVYAVGAILFEILSGRRLFEFPRDTSIAKMRECIVAAAPRALSEVLPQCPKSLDDLVRRAVQRNPADRYLSMAALSRALKRITMRLYGPAVSPEPRWNPAKGELVPETNWRLEREIGRGSTGPVWLARHDSLSEKRVFKFCDDEDKVRTLKRELALFRLLKERVGHHPHFITLHEVSLEEPPWYLMMEHVEAVDLPAWCARFREGGGTITAEQKIELIIQVSQALQSAHEAGILHRDIKPENLLVAKRDDTPGGWHVYVADFGIGQLTAAEFQQKGVIAGATLTLLDVERKSLSGTFLYFAPEILEGNAATARSDLYSLGVVFWQLLIGNFSAALDPVRWPARIDDPLLRSDLEKCLAGDPEDRWLSAGDFAASLRSLDARRTAEARRQEELARRAKEAYRRGVWRASLVAGATIIAIAALAIYAWLNSVEAEQQRKIAAAGHARAALGELRSLNALRFPGAHFHLSREMQSLEIRDPALRAQFREVAIAILAQNPFESLALPEIQFGEDDMVGDRGERVAALGSSGTLEVMDMVAHPRQRRRVSRDERGLHHLRVGARGLVAGAIDESGTLHVWSGRNLASHDPSDHRAISGPVHAGSFAITPTHLVGTDYSAVAVARPDGAIEVYRTGSGQTTGAVLRRVSNAERREFPETAPANLLEFARNPEGVLASASPHSNLLLFWRLSPSENRVTGAFVGSAWHRGVVQTMKWNPLGEELATGADDGVLRIWRFAVSETVPQVVPHRSLDLGEPIHAVAWNADATLLAAVTASGQVRVFWAQSLDSRPALQFSQPKAKNVAFLGSDSLCTWGGGETRIHGKRDKFFVQRKISASPVTVDFHSQGSLTASGPDVINFLVPETLAWTAGFTTAVAPAASWLGSELIFFENQQWKFAEAVKVPDPHRLHFSFKDNLAGSGAYVASPQGRRMAVLQRNRLHCWSSVRHAEGEAAQTLGNLTLLAMSDGLPLSAWVEGSSIRVHDHREGKTKSFDLGTSRPLGLSFSPEQGLLAVRESTGVRFIETLSGRSVFAPVAAPTGGATPVVFSPDGRCLAVCGPDYAILIGAVLPQWPSDSSVLQPAFAQPIPLRAPFPSRIVSLDWNSAGTRIAAGTTDGFVQSWNVSLLREKLRLWNMDWNSEPIPREPEPLFITLY
jgi:serine/threonine protein kinase/WD40 repeat protein